MIDFLNKKGRVNIDDLNLAFVGHSFIEGNGAGANYIANKVHSLPLLAGSGLPIKSRGVGGRRWSTLATNHTAEDAFYVAGKRNIMITMLALNSIASEGRTGLQACADAKTAIDSIKAVNSGWEVYDISTPPYRNTGFEVGNVQIDIYNKEMSDNHHLYNIDGVIDVRATDSPFALTNYSLQSLATLDPYMATGEKSINTYSVHMNSTGYDIVAKYISQMLRGIG